MEKVFAALRSARLFGLAWACGLLLTVLMVIFALTEHLPVRDPDDVMLRFPAILLGVIAIDIVPRVVVRARGQGDWSLHTLGALTKHVLRERWSVSHWGFALSGLFAWYLCYATFRNVKNMAPFVNHHQYDSQLSHLDHFLWAGHDPAAVLHAWFGTGIAAHVFSLAYIAWIGLVPISIAIALVWTRHTSAGSWYVTAVAVDWVLGALLYVLVPTLGPIYTDKSEFAQLPHTYVTVLENDLWSDRSAVLAHPWASGTLQTIAAFPSLHVGIMVTICLSAQLIGLPRWIRVTCWVFLAVTVLGTVYLGWHFFTDTLAGAVVGAFAVWIAGIATGNRRGWRARLVNPEERSGAPTEPADASGARPAPLG